MAPRTGLQVETFGNVGSTLAGAVVTPMESAVRGLSQRIAAASERAFAPLEGASKRLGEAMSGIANSAFTPAKAALSSLSEGITGKLVGGAFGPLEQAATQFSGGLVNITEGISGFYGQLQAAGSSMGQFVGLFSPSLLLPFQQAMRDLGALIGSALAPAFQILTEVVKGVGANLAPVFAQLAKIITPLAQIMGDVFLRVVKSLSNAFQAMAPLIEMAVRALAPIIDGLASMAEAVTAVVTSIVGAFTEGLDPKKNGLVSLGEKIGALFKQLAAGLVLVVAAIAKWFGAEGILRHLEANLKPQAQGARDITGLAAAQGAAFSSFAEFGRKMALAASVATGAPKVDKAQEEKDWRDGVRKDVEALAKGTKTVDQVLAAWGQNFRKEFLAGLEELWGRLAPDVKFGGGATNPGLKVGGLLKWLMGGGAGGIAEQGFGGGAGGFGG